MNKCFSSSILALITLTNCGRLQAEAEMAKGALIGTGLGAAIGAAAGGKDGAGIGAAVGLGAGLFGGAIAKSERHQREREEVRAVHYAAPRPSRYALEQKIEELSDRNESLLDQNDALRDQVSQLQRSLTTKKQRIAALDAQVENLQIQNQELREDIRALRKMYTSDMADMKNANLSLKKELAGVKKDMDRLKKKAKLITNDDDEDESLI